MKKCNHCKGDIKIRNPKGFCDHLYYPENCDVCNKTVNMKTKLREQIKEIITNEWDEEHDYDRCRFNPTQGKFVCVCSIPESQKKCLDQLLQAMTKMVEEVIDEIEVEIASSEKIELPTFPDTYIKMGDVLHALDRKHTRLKELL